MDLQRLKQQTSDDHRAAEYTVPLMGEGLNPSQYVQCLRQIYGVVAAWEERAADLAPEWLQPILLARRRLRFLELDLTSFGVTANDDRCATLPEMKSLPGLFGTMYVMEGSTLGGQFLARHVETVLHLSDGQGTSYFRGYGHHTEAMWKEFCEMLKLRISDEQTDLVVASAKAMFSTFETWMQKKSAKDDS